MMVRISYLPFGASPVKKDIDIAQEAMERLGILALANRIFQELSGGERQMILLARAVAQQAEVLVMDEPAANLDYGNQVKLLKTAKSLVSRNYAVLMTTIVRNMRFWCVTGPP